MKMKTFTQRTAALCRLIPCAALFLFCPWQKGQAQYTSYSIINTHAGSGLVTPGERNCTGIVVSPSGTVYFTSANTHQVYRTASPYTTAILVAGNGTPVSSGDGGPAASASLSTPAGLALDAAGNLYIAEMWGHRVRKVDAATGIITTIAGTGASGFTGDGSAATSARLRTPKGLAIGPNGNLYIADLSNYRIRMVNLTSGAISTVAGIGASGPVGDGGAATAARLNLPTDVTFDNEGNMIIAEFYGVRRVDAATGIITTVAGTGSLGITPDGYPATSTSFHTIQGVTADAAGNLFISEGENHRIRRVDAATGIVATVAGTGSPGFAGNGGPASQARLHSPNDITTDAAGNLIFGQSSFQTVRKIAVDGIISSIYAPRGSVAAPHGDGGDRLAADFHTPRDVAVDAAGNVYIADAGLQRVRKVDAATGIVSTVAGTGETGFLDDGVGGLATRAMFNDVAGLALDAAGNIYIADRNNDRVRKVTVATGVITTVAGNRVRGFAGMGGPATAASINRPQDMAVDAAGNLFISSSYNHAIFRVDAVTGIITVVAGTGTAGYSGDGGAATSAQLYGVHGILIDGAGNLILCDKYNHRIREVNLTTGIIRTIAGTGVPGIANDGELATTAQLSQPDDIALAPNGDLVISDLGNHRMRLLQKSTGRLYSVAGNGTVGFSGDGGEAILAQMNEPCGMAITASGLTYISDQFNHRIRTFTFPGITPPAVLPLDFLSFTASKKAGVVDLAWTTANEVGTRSFIVERMERGSKWQIIGEVGAAVNSHAQQRYHFTDATVSSKTYHYRLKQVDQDGRHTYSKTVSVSFNNTKAAPCVAYPSLFTDQLTVIWNGTKGGTTTVRLVNLAGQVRMEKKVSSTDDRHMLSLTSLARLGSGVYFLQVTGRGVDFSQKVVRR